MFESIGIRTILNGRPSHWYKTSCFKKIKSIGAIVFELHARTDKQTDKITNPNALPLNTLPHPPGAIVIDCHFVNRGSDKFQQRGKQPGHHLGRLTFERSNKGGSEYWGDKGLCRSSASMVSALESPPSSELTPSFTFWPATVAFSCCKQLLYLERNTVRA